MRPFGVFLFLIGLVTAAPSPRSGHVLHEKRAFESPDWVQTQRLNSDHILQMRFGLTQSNLHKLEEMLMAISHPKSASYGKHYTAAEVVDAFAPSTAAINAVTDWLVSSGIGSERLRLSASKGWIEVNATAVEVEDLLNAEYHVYQHSSGTQQIGCESYYLPQHVREHIDIVKPSVHFNHAARSKHRRKRDSATSNVASNLSTHIKTNGQKISAAATPASLADCDTTITIPCLQALYSIDYTPVSTSVNTYGIVELTPQAFLQGDLDMFFANFSPNLVGTSPTLVSIDGGVAQTTSQSFNDNGESDLDLEYAMGLTNPQPILLLQDGDLVEGGSFDNWLDAVDGSFCTFEGGDVKGQDGIYPDAAAGGFDEPESCGIITPPNVISVSYGGDEFEVSATYANRQCAEYGKIGLMGTTVLYSSGDDGVAGNDGRCLGLLGVPTRLGTKFVPGFPVGCPFLTAVGATQIDPGNTVNDPEGACEQVIFSGGGFSNIFAMPDYQADAVTSFLTNTPPPFTSAQFNNSGQARAYPDLSANGANYVIAIDGEFELVFGTSASSPVVGSIITLINDARIAAGKSSVGFINPTIYSSDFASGFNDITHGGNQGCGTAGFTATAGWDPVTGVGTPNLTKLMELWLALP